ncbi:hypothetical protein NMY22_g3268 [Coprinellus aureogranulatus]|nr:hypothetical protein NMY22_g3268 [Coprinellus aureogranulatus]
MPPRATPPGTAKRRLPPFLTPDADRSVCKGKRVDDGDWLTSHIQVSVPLLGTVRKRTVGTFYHRSIMSIIRAKLASEPDMQHFHYEPYEVTWQPDISSPPQRVYSELYSSDAFVRAHRELQDSPHPLGCDRPRVVLGLMIWSDATHVTSFSSEKLWPCYMAFANESKYRRCMPSLNLFHHIAYFAELQDSFEDYITTQTGGGNLPPKLIPYLNQEAMHAQWAIILGEAGLQDAIANGFIFKCSDGRERRFYIRIFTYSADYPEKQVFPSHPSQSSTHNLMGTPEDLSSRLSSARRDDDARRQAVKTSRKKLLGDGVGLTTSGVDGPLKDQSLQPVWVSLAQNAFSTPALTASGFDIFNAMAVDLLHEFEQGIWKDVFLHILRILDASASGNSLRTVLDRRFRQVPPFGRAIRRFSGNVSQTKRTAARDWEDVLQCAIPVFEGILPNSDHSDALLSVITVCAEWHALAKLRLHTDGTLQLLQDATVKLGNELRSFAEGVCQEVKTRETKDEAEAREKVAKKKSKAKSGAPASASDPKPRGQENRPARVNGGNKSNATNQEGSAPSASEHSGPNDPLEKRRGSDTASEGTDRSKESMQIKENNGSQERLFIRIKDIKRRLAFSGTANASTEEGADRITPVQEKGRGRDTEEDNAGGALEVRGKARESAEETTKGKAKGTAKGKGRGKAPTAPSMDCGIEPTAASSSSREIGSDEADNGENGGDEEATGDPEDGATAECISGSKKGGSNDREPRRRPVKFSLENRNFTSLETTLVQSECSGELMHRSSKRWYKQSSKRNPRKEVVRHERKVARIRAIRRELNRQKEANALKAKTGDDPKEEAEQGDAVRKPEAHHYIGSSQNIEVPLASFASDAALVDPFTKTFIPTLQKHLLPRLAAVVRKEAPKSLEGCQSFEQHLDATRISFHRHRLFSHKIMHIYYTTYDVRRGEDIVHLGSSSGMYNIMIPNPRFRSDPDQPPYLYARVEGIYHGYVSYAGEVSPGVAFPIQEPIRVEFLKVSPDSMSFIDPAIVLRAVHIIPRFRRGQKPPKSGAQRSAQRPADETEWLQYWVNRYADRDMYMRYRIGQAVGHTGVWSLGTAPSTALSSAASGEMDVDSLAINN